MKIGIIGPGSIARSFAQSVNLTHGVELYAVASRDIKRAEEFAAEYGANLAYGSYEDLIADKNIDAVYIATPHNLHAKYTELCLENDIAVLCEKPYTLTHEQAAKTVALSKKKNVLFMEGMWSRFHPAYAKTKEWIARGAIGDVRLIESSFSFYSDTNPESRLYNKELGGGALFDVGVYGIEYSMGIADCEKAKVTGVATIGSTGVDEMASISMLFDNSIIAHTTCGLKATTEDDCHIYGTKGKIVIYRFWNSHKVHLYDAKRELIESFEDKPIEGLEKSFIAEIEAFRDSFNRGECENSIMPHSHTVACARYFDLLRAQWGIN